MMPWWRSDLCISVMWVAFTYILSRRHHQAFMCALLAACDVGMACRGIITASEDRTCPDAILYTASTVYTFKDGSFSTMTTKQPRD